VFPNYLLQRIRAADGEYKGTMVRDFSLPKYNPKTYYLELTRSKYFYALIELRHYGKIVSDYYFSVKQNAMCIDLFMLTPSISSPMGPGSDSEVIPVRFGKYMTNLVDSSQFGFEPLLLNGIDKVYCYLPSMRGEKPDKRHLNQFFHCESEIKGTLEDIIPVAEGYVKVLAETFLTMPHILGRISANPKKSNEGLRNLLKIKHFPSVTFDEAVDLLISSGKKEFVHFAPSGRDITSDGEVALAELLGFKTPFWVKYYDRDRVPFYQKPYPRNKEKTVNADLIFPALAKHSFGGEIVGCGQRQDDSREMVNSLKRQGIDQAPYEWYINLRKLPAYRTTSGFGLGIERFIAWSLCHDDIKDGILYPRLKNVKTYP
jgi:aspartyl/asparaginyl-tRNA synthetase